MLIVEYIVPLAFTVLVTLLLIAAAYVLAYLVSLGVATDSDKKNNPDNRDLLAEYGRAWSLHQLVPFIDKLLLGAYGQAMDNRMLVPWEKGPADWFVRLPLVIASFLFPSPVVLLAAHIMNVVSWATWMPAVWDHMVWAALTEIVFVGAALGGGGRKAVAERFLPAARAMLVVLYFSAAFWKLTTSWYEQYSSCAPVLLAELLSGLVPPHLLPAGGVVANFLLFISPVFVAALEFAVASALLLRPDAGVLLALAFHQTINLMPMTYAGGFSIAMCSRFVIFLPGAWSTSLTAGGSFILPSAIVTAIGALMFVIHSGIDTACVAYLFFAFIYLRALFTHGLSGLAKQEPAKLLRWGSVLLAFVYGFLTPILGIQAMAASTMYGNLKQYGGGNHILVPTGILQEYFATNQGPSWAVDAFGGGLLRVDETDSSVMQELSPAEATPQLPEQARSLLVGYGTPGRYFELYARRNYFGRNEDLNASALHNRGSYGLPVDDMPYAQPAYELRRVLALMRKRGEAFKVKYTHLPWRGTPGEYRDHTGPQVTLEEDPAKGLILCTIRNGKWFGHCAADEPPLQPPPPRWLTWILHPYPMPLLKGDKKEVHCST